MWYIITTGVYSDLHKEENTMNKIFGKKAKKVLSVFLSLLMALSLFALTPVLAAEEEIGPCPKAPFHNWSARVDYPSTCTSFGQMSYYCDYCGMKQPGSETSLSIKAHDVDNSAPERSGEGDGFRWNAYGCKDCDFMRGEVLIIVRDEKGNPVQGAKVKIYDDELNYQASSTTNEKGEYADGYVSLKDGGYGITVSSKDLARSSVGVLVIVNGVVDGSIQCLDVEHGPCNCICHLPIIGPLYSGIFKIIGKIIGRTVKCCDDMV